MKRNSISGDIPSAPQRGFQQQSTCRHYIPHEPDTLLLKNLPFLGQVYHGSYIPIQNNLVFAGHIHMVRYPPRVLTGSSSAIFEAATLQYLTRFIDNSKAGRLELFPKIPDARVAFSGSSLDIQGKGQDSSLLISLHHGM